MSNIHNWPNADSSFCSECGTPSQIEALLKGEASPAEQTRWQNHLENSPSCRQAALEDAKLRKVFAEYRADPFFDWLDKGWQPDFSKLNVKSSAAADADLAPATTVGKDGLVVNFNDKKFEKTELV